ncbi:MAG: LacI family transcriptional regulator [Verrucomicrobiales bacterium]|jgi:LacI family transcriptional regulator|nr:LacI family transcriptional regulator [Verrucomicrobiales bacterium]
MTFSPVTLDDIAQKLGITVSTASRALRDLPGIHPSTRAKIVEAAQKLGYVAPRKRKQDANPPRHILTLTLGGEVPSLFLSGMSRASLQFNFSLVSHHFAQGEAHRLLDPKHQPHLLRMGQVSGVVLIYKWPDEVVAALSRKLPVISLIVQYPNLPVDLVGIDHTDGMFTLIRHLQKNGHRRIGFFGLNAEASWSHSRFAAYLEALFTLGLPVDFSDNIKIEDTSAMAVFPYQNKKIYDTVIDKIKAGVKAWVCADDVIAHSLCAALVQRGLKIPADVAITGFHRYRFPSSTLPELTSVIIGEETLGVSALRRLAFRLDHPDDLNRSILLPPQFYQGQTTAKV